MRTDVKALIPSRRVMIAAMQANRRLGHENLGFLSTSHGAMPIEPPLQSLNPAYAVWDEVAARLPALCQSLTLRQRLDDMPLLRADNPLRLGDAELLRAAALIGAFAHAYYYIGAAPPAAGLPPTILTPWRDIAARLQRREAHLSYVDMSTYNWRLRDPAGPDPLTVENLDLLVPVWGNEAERIFLASTIETQAKSTPLINAIIQAQEAAVNDDPLQLEAALAAMLDCLRHLTRVCMAKISPRRDSGFFVDPVCWAKTVAPLSAPLRKGAAGPVGAATLAFQALDAFLGREDYRGRVGQSSLLARQWFPRHWRDFYAAVGAVSVPGYLRNKSSPFLGGLFREVAEAYAGDNGYLDRHRIKTYGYIETAFKSGRTATAAFQGSFADRVWETIDDELKQAQAQRCPAALPARTEPVLPKPIAGPADANVYAMSEIVLHNDDSRGYWLIVDGGVHDIGSYRHAHPGGFKILRAYAGMDATAAFRRAGHHRHPHARGLLAAYRIGAVRQMPALEASALYGRWLAYVFRVVEIENALHNDYSFRREAAVAGETAGRIFMSPAKVLLLLKTHQRFAGELLPGLVDDAALRLWQDSLTPAEGKRQADLAASMAGRVAAEPSVRWLARLDDGVNGAGALCNAELKMLQGVCLTLEGLDLALISQLKLLVREVLLGFECAGDAHIEPAAIAGIRAALRAYFSRLTAMDASRAGLTGP